MATTPVYNLRYQALSDAPHGPNLGQDLALDVEDELVRIDAAKPAASSATSNAGFNTTSLTFTATGGADVAVVFTAKSNSAILHFAAALRQQNASNNVYVSPEVRTGAVVGSGTVVLAADQENCVRVSDTSTTRFGASYHLTGLTPGNQYNVRLLHSVAPGGTGEIAARHLAVLTL